MKKNKTIKYIIITLIIMLAIICPNFSSAWDLGLGRQMTVGFNNTSCNQYKLVGNNNLYCVNKNQTIHSDTKNTYEVRQVITINGKKAINRTSTGTVTSTNKYNARIAYILSKEGLPKTYGSYTGGKVYYSDRQRAVYKIWDEWTQNSGLGMKTYGTAVPEQTTSAKNLYNEAVKYAESTESEEASITSVNGNTVSYKNNGIAIGPFKIKYTGNKIDKITVTYSDGTKKDISKVYKDVDCTNELEVANIKSDTKFFIKETYTDKSATKVKMHVKSDSTMKVTIYHLISTSSPSSKQRLIAVNTEKVPTEADVEIEVSKAPITKLKINKVDQETGNAIQGIGFKIYSETRKKWVAGEAGAYKFVGKSEAEIYTTNSNGKITLKKIEPGTYHIYETKGTTAYPLEKQAGLGEKDLFGFVTAKNKWIYFGSVTIDYGKKVEVEKTYKNKGTPPPPGGSSGTIDITKVDANNTGKKLKAGFKIYNVDKKQWLVGANKSYSYTNYDKAAKYYTNQETGNLRLENLDYGTYRVYEVEAPEGYKLSVQEGYAKTDVYEWVYCGEQTIAETASQMVAVYNLKNRETPPPPDTPPPSSGGADGKIIINKVDKDNTNKKLKAGFKIYNVDKKQWLEGTNKPYSYTNYNKATTYYTNQETGSLTLENLDYGTYRVYEVEAPSGYKLSAQPEGYAKTDIYEWVYCGEQTITEKEETKTATYDLKNKYEDKISISGYVWVDVPNTKANTYNSRYDENAEADLSQYNDLSLASKKETKIEGITVNLKKKSDNTTIATTQTDTNGNYIFKQIIEKEKLKEYYIEFDYSSVNKGQYKKYIPVAFNDTNKNNIVANGSRAMQTQVAEYDRDLTGIASTYRGTTDETTYGLSGNFSEKLFNKESNTLENINLGIKALPDINYALTQDISYVKIKIKGYEYKYKYNGRKGNSGFAAAPTVNWQNSNDISVYSVSVYPSDVVYSSQSGITDGLEVYVIYRIDITNTVTYKIEELYTETKLHIASLTNKFDRSKYELDTKHDIGTSADLGFGDWKMKAEDTVEYTGKTFSEGISKYNKENPSDCTKTVYVQYKLINSRIQEILSGEKKITAEPSEATAIGYHEYTRKDYSWQNNITAQQTHYTEDMQKTDKAPGMIFALGEDRTVEGKVFEDTVTAENETKHKKLGNGQYDNNENLVNGVKVELLDINGDGTAGNVSATYTNDNGKGTITPNGAIATTGNDGNYKISGIVPGLYYLRFTYGDGTQIIYDTSGNPIKTNGVDKQVKHEDYKSTIITSNPVKKALGNEGTGATDRIAGYKGTGELKTNGKDTWTWYKELESTNYSVAVDNLETREKYNKNAPSAGSQMDAYTATVSITVENTKQDSSENATAGTEPNATQKETFGGLNFGIIEQTKQKLDIEKRITNIKITNLQNNVIVDGNPVSGKLKSVSDLSENKDSIGSTYVRAEISENELYGSEVLVTYTIKVKNITDYIDYFERQKPYDGWYYIFGDDTHSEEVTVTPEEVIDYLDPLAEYVRGDEGIVQLKYNKEEKAWYYEANKVNNSDELASKTGDDYNTLLSIRGWKDLYSKNSSHDPKEDAKTIITKRLLSSSDDDTELINKAEVIKAHTQAEDTYSRKPIILPDPAQAILTITPPTGGDKDTIMTYFGVGAIALIVLGTGIIIIKKRLI